MNCQKGDLAVIVHDTYEENLGRFVKVLSRSRYEGMAGMEPGVQWTCEPQSPIKADYLTHGGGFLYTQTRMDDVDMPDAWLRPIRPDGITTEEVKELFSPSPAKESEKV